VAVAESGEAPLLSVRDLSVEFQTPDGPVTVVSGVDLAIHEGEVLGLVGESGSGKSVTSSAIMRLIPTPPGRITSGSVRLSGRELTTLSFEQMRKLRGNDIAMVFQDPMSSLDPAFTVGFQLIEALRFHRSMSKAAARSRALALLDMVGIPEPELRLDDYPHQMSGGMRQRVLIAIALINDPRLLIADEPTTALDVTVQAQIIELLKSLQTGLGMGMLFVTHDMGVIANIADRVAVMYAGQVVETGPVDELFENPRHPYTKALLEAIPQVTGGDERLASIPGVVPTPDAFPAACRFADRCSYATDECRSEPIPMFDVAPEHHTRCLHHDDLRAER
jgi:oligopeptide/dipeptide ABC transporter ATP-binding protein